MSGGIVWGTNWWSVYYQQQVVADTHPVWKSSRSPGYLRWNTAKTTSAGVDFEPGMNRWRAKLLGLQSESEGESAHADKFDT